MFNSLEGIMVQEDRDRQSEYIQLYKAKEDRHVCSLVCKHNLCQSSTCNPEHVQSMAQMHASVAILGEQTEMSKPNKFADGRIRVSCKPLGLEEAKYCSCQSHKTC